MGRLRSTRLFSDLLFPATRSGSRSISSRLGEHGFGGLSDKFAQITDQSAVSSSCSRIATLGQRIQNDITDLNDRIGQLQTRVAARLQAADALQAQLTAQQALLSATLQLVVLHELR